MNIIRRKAIIDFCVGHPDAKTALNTWFVVCRKAAWKTYHELQKDFPEAFPVGDSRVVFDIKGNRYRLVARVLFTYNQIQIKWIGTHREYDRINVKTVKKY